MQIDTTPKCQGKLENEQKSQTYKYHRRMPLNSHCYRGRFQNEVSVLNTTLLCDPQCNYQSSEAALGESCNCTHTVSIDFCLHL